MIGAVVENIIGGYLHPRASVRRIIDGGHGFGVALLMVLLARFNPAWRDALHVAKPETLLGSHRSLFVLIWRRKSRSGGCQPRRLDNATIELIVSMAQDNALWGAERIRGELLKLGIRVSKRTIQKYMKRGRPPAKRGQTWGPFLENHAHDSAEFGGILATWGGVLLAKSETEAAIAELEAAREILAGALGEDHTEVRGVDRRLARARGDDR